MGMVNIETEEDGYMCTGILRGWNVKDSLTMSC